MKKDYKYTLLLLSLLVCLFIYNIIKPYNYVEFNSATIYYQTYGNLQAKMNDLSFNLSNYLGTEKNEHITKAISDMAVIEKLIPIFKLTLNCDFRNTIINQKVIKPPSDLYQDLEILYLSLHDLQKYLESYLAETKKYNKETLTNINDILKKISISMEPGDYNLGYDEKRKEFKIILSQDQYEQLHENIYKLQDQLAEMLDNQQQTLPK